MRGNPHIVVDPSDNTVVRIVRGHPMQSFEIAAGIARAEAQRRGRELLVVAHPYVPQGFRTGAKVSPLFYHYKPLRVSAEGKFIIENPLTPAEAKVIDAMGQKALATGRELERTGAPISAAMKYGQGGAYRYVATAFRRGARGNPPVSIPEDLRMALGQVMAWKGNWAARPYAQALLYGDTGFDEPKSVLLYLWGNLKSWRGPEAQQAKAIITKYAKLGLPRVNPLTKSGRQYPIGRPLSPNPRFYADGDKGPYAAKSLIIAPSSREQRIQVVLRRGQMARVVDADRIDVEDTARRNPRACACANPRTCAHSNPMKMPPAHYEALRQAVLPYMRETSKRGQFSAERNRWDALWMAVDRKEFDYSSLHELHKLGFKDAHIDTALRRIQAEATGSSCVRPNPMKFLTAEDRKRLPPLYSQESKGEDAIAQVKFFTPWTNWTWYATEFDGQDTFFGLVQGQEEELGYFSLSELQSIRGPVGMRIERDMYFRPTPLRQLRKRSNPLTRREREGFLGEAKRAMALAKADERDKHSLAAEYWKGRVSGLAHAALSNPSWYARGRRAGWKFAREMVVADPAKVNALLDAEAPGYVNAFDQLVQQRGKWLSEKLGKWRDAYEQGFADGAAEAVRRPGENPLRNTPPFPWGEPDDGEDEEEDPMGWWRKNPLLPPPGIFPNRAPATRGQYIRRRVAPPSQFDPRSFRTIQSGSRRVVIGCPKGQWDPRRGVCKVGTRAQSILYPMKAQYGGRVNPLTEDESLAIEKEARVMERQIPYATGHGGARFFGNAEGMRRVVRDYGKPSSTSKDYVPWGRNPGKSQSELNADWKQAIGRTRGKPLPKAYGRWLNSFSRPPTVAQYDKWMQRAFESWLSPRGLSGRFGRYNPSSRFSLPPVSGNLEKAVREAENLIAEFLHVWNIKGNVVTLDPRPSDELQVQEVEGVMSRHGFRVLWSDEASRWGRLNPGYTIGTGRREVRLTDAQARRMMAKNPMVEVHLKSVRWVYTPGILRWAMHGYQFKEDRARMVKVLTDGYSLPPKVAHGLLSGEIPYKVVGEDVVFTADMPKGFRGSMKNPASFYPKAWVASVARREAARPNPLLQTVGLAANPPVEKPPFREGEKVPIEKARKWVQSTGNRELIEQFEQAYKLQCKANRPPKFVEMRTIPIGSSRKIDDVMALVEYGKVDETRYTPPKGSKKGRHLYEHKWGEKGGERSVPLLATPDGKALVMPLGKGKVASDWLRG